MLIILQSQPLIKFTNHVMVMSFKVSDSCMVCAFLITCQWIEIRWLVIPECLVIQHITKTVPHVIEHWASLAFEMSCKCASTAQPRCVIIESFWDKVLVHFPEIKQILLSIPRSNSEALLFLLVLIPSFVETLSFSVMLILHIIISLDDVGQSKVILVCFTFWLWLLGKLLLVMNCDV